MYASTDFWQVYTIFVWQLLKRDSQTGSAIDSLFVHASQKNMEIMKLRRFWSKHIQLNFTENRSANDRCSR